MNPQNLQTIQDLVPKFTPREFHDATVGAFVGGVFIALLLVGTLWVVWQVWHEKPDPPPVQRRPLPRVKIENGVEKIVPALIVGVLLLSGARVSLAQTNTPVPPTATIAPTQLVALSIPINTIMTSTNGWLGTFAPIAALGIGISIALAILAYLGKMIKSAFT